jgi:tRNA(fMet)-specific endonuclease VapC
LGELCFGAYKSGRVKENLARIDEYAANNVVLGCGIDTAYRYGEIRSALQRKGRPIPENDIWIAAIALQLDLTLVTRDTHFEEIDGLKVMTWS